MWWTNTTVPKSICGKPSPATKDHRDQRDQCDSQERKSPGWRLGNRDKLLVLLIKICLILLGTIHFFLGLQEKGLTLTHVKTMFRVTWTMNVYTCNKSPGSLQRTNGTTCHNCSIFLRLKHKENCARSSRRASATEFRTNGKNWNGPYKMDDGLLKNETVTAKEMNKSE